ncbi:MAG: hypothetical protein WC240_05715 [Bacilli bacterium]|jgi:hypothetical protein
MEYFKSLTQAEIEQIILSTKESLYICMPAIHEELESAITYLDYSNDNSKTEIKIHILIDFDSQTFRQGYGNFKSVEDLINGGFDVKCLKDNRISFIISDNIGYYLFIESRSLIPADKKTINAVKIDPVSIVRLKKFFFTETENSDFQDDLVNAIIEESKQLKNTNELLSEQIASVTEISNIEIESVSEVLKKNPPIHPDFKRIVEFYSNKFQYVKVKFEGANLQYRKIEIPSKALPIMDATLKDKLETKLNLFEKSDEENCFKPLIDFKTKLTEIRDAYLTKVKSRDESLLDKLKKSAFEEQIENLKKEINGVKNDIIGNIAEQINQTKIRLLADLIDFFIANPKSLFPNHPNLWESNQNYIRQSAKSKAEEVIYRIKWPEAHLLVDDFKLSVQYSDITYEDLKSQEFVNELKDFNLIDESDENRLAEFGKGVKINPE